MACQVKRNSQGEIDKVLAPNGKESIAYQSILSSLKDAPNISALRERFKSWEGKHIESVEDDKELALGFYKQLYSPSFKSWFGDWEQGEGSKVVDANGEPLVVYHGTDAFGFSSFAKELLGSNTGAPSARLGFFFASNKQASRKYLANKIYHDLFRDIDYSYTFRGDSGYSDLDLAAEEAFLSKFENEKEQAEERELIEDAYRLSNAEKAFDLGDITKEQLEVEKETMRSKYQIPTNIANIKNKLVTSYLDDVIKSWRRDEYGRPINPVTGSHITTSNLTDLRRGVLHSLRQLYGLEKVKDLKAEEDQALDKLIYPIFLNIRDPLTQDYQGQKKRIATYASIISSASEQGKDGTILLNTFDPEATDVFVPFSAEQIKSPFNIGAFSSASKNIYQQTEIPKITPSKASTATLKTIKEFLNRIGVNVQTVGDIIIDGGRLGANGIADPLNALIQVTQGKEDVALTEEAMHMAVEIIEQKNPALFKRLMNEINDYRLVDEIFQNYGGIPSYQIDGKPDVIKLKKEAIGKVLAQVLINKAEDITEKPELLARVKSLWQQIIDFLKGLFLKAQMNPFEEVAQKVLSEEEIGHIREITPTSGSFLQVNQSLLNKINQVNQNTAKTNTGYEVNGEKVRHTVEEKVKELFDRREAFRTVTDVMRENREYKKEVEQNTKEDIKDILSRYIDDNSDLRETPLEQTIPSSVDPYNSSFYTTLSDHIGERLRSYPSGTKFSRSVNLVDDKTSTAASVDLIALLENGKVDVLQFHVPELGRDLRDIPPYQLEAYNIEMEGIRTILQNGYGIPRKQFRNTRVLPIRAVYNYNIPGNAQSGLRLVDMMVGNTNVKVITDDVLLPVASKSETTGDEQLDRFLHRLSGLAEKYAKEKVPPDKIIEKAQRVAKLVAAIRKLKVQGKAEGILSLAKTVIRQQQEAIQRITQQIDNFNPQEASTKEINDLAGQILSQKDEVELYSELHGIFQDLFSGGTDGEEEYVRDARDVSDNANALVRKYWKLSVRFRTEKIAAKFGIKDEFNPEKQLTWYRRMIRSLSQSSIKAGDHLWELVKNINSRLDTEFHDRLKRLEKIEEGVQKWLKGRKVEELYNRIFQIKDGKWNGGFVQKFSKQFYKEVRDAQESQNIRWVRDNIDIDAYNQWYLEEHQRRVDQARTQRVHEDDQRNRELIYQSLQNFVNTFSLRQARGVNPHNYKIKDFPLKKWESEEYQELSKPENAPVMDLYNYWIEKLEESLDEGLIQEHNGWSWFPNVRRNLLEKLTSAPTSGKFKSLLGNLRIEAEDTSFGKIEPISGKSLNEVHANFVSDLGEWVKDADGNYFKSYSEKSMDVFKVLALWEKEIVKFKLKTESENIAKMIQYTEEGRTGYKTTRTGKLEKDEYGFPIIIDNKRNAEYTREHVEAVWYGKRMSDESDISIDIPYKSIVQRINKLFGKHMLDEPEEESIKISGVKALGTINRFFTLKTLGLNVLTSLSQLFGGTANTYMNQGRFFDKKDVLESEFEYTAGRFWGSDESKKMAGLLAYLHIYTDDHTARQIRQLSVSNAVKHLSSDHLFVGQRLADRMVNDVITMSFIKNTMIVDGKLVNIREYAKQELGHEEKYQGTMEQVKQFNKRLETRIAELRDSPSSLLKSVRIENDQIVIPGIQRDSDTLVNFREQVKNFTKDALGNISSEDLSLYKRSVMLQSFAMFKNWIPRMFDVRFQSLKFVPGSDQYEWGRMRMVSSAVYNLVKNTNTSLLKTLIGRGGEDIIEVAKEVYRKKQQEKAEQEEEFDMTEAEFVDMYIKGVRAGFKELGLAISMLGILIAARAYAPDKDKDPEARGAYKWMLRGIDKLQDEVSFFYNPISFTNIFNGSVFPAVGILVDISKFMENAALKAFFLTIGDEKAAAKHKSLKYLFKLMPLTKELMTYIAIFNEDFAKEYGIKLSSQYGNFR